MFDKHKICILFINLIIGTYIILLFKYLEYNNTKILFYKTKQFIKKSIVVKYNNSECVDF